MFLPPQNTLHNTSPHTVSLYTADLGEVTVFVSSQDGWTALHMAAQEGKVDVVRLLLTEAQALVNIQTKVHSHYITTSGWSHVTRAESVNKCSLCLCITYSAVWTVDMYNAMMCLQYYP